MRETRFQGARCSMRVHVMSVDAIAGGLVGGQEDNPLLSGPAPSSAWAGEAGFSSLLLAHYSQWPRARIVGQRPGMRSTKGHWNRARNGTGCTSMVIPDGGTTMVKQSVNVASTRQSADNIERTRPLFHCHESIPSCFFARTPCLEAHLAKLGKALFSRLPLFCTARCTSSSAPASHRSASLLQRYTVNY